MKIIFFSLFTAQIYVNFDIKTVALVSVLRKHNLYVKDVYKWTFIITTKKILFKRKMNKPLTDDWNLKFQLQNLSNPFNKTFKYYCIKKD